MNKSILFVATCIFTIVASNAMADQIRDSVVKIFVTSNSMDFYRPWQSKGIKSSGGSGSIIKGKRILTNAHVVTDQTFIQVKKTGDPKKYTAKLEAIGHDCDLALLSVEDESFFENTTPLKFGELPNLQETVAVIGYPQGGDKISVTEGVVSRVEITNYAQSGRKLLTIQIDAAINPGNSGGPVVQNGKQVGVAMQHLKSGQNIGYTIPIPIVEHFLEDLEDNHYDGFPILGIDYNRTENATLRKHYSIDKMSGGVLMTRILPFSPASGIIQEGDIILEINGIKIGEDGTFQFRENERLSLTHLITKEQIGSDVDLKVMRNGEIKDLQMPLLPYTPLVSYPHHYKKPPYYIYGGLIFTVLSTDLLKSWGNRWWEKAPVDFNHYLYGSGRININNKKEIVVLLNVLSDDINVGYHNFNNEVIASVNGQTFESFKEFILLLSNVKKNEDVSLFKTSHNYQIIINNMGIEEVTKSIIDRNNIPTAYSKDVEQWLKNVN